MVKFSALLDEVLTNKAFADMGCGGASPRVATVVKREDFCGSAWALRPRAAAAASGDGFHAGPLEEAMQSPTPGARAGRAQLRVLSQ